MFLEFALSPSFMDPNMIAISTQVQAPDDFQRVAFDIRHGNRRIACTLTTKFPTKDQAKRYFHANRPLIEKLAREQMELVAANDGEIKLVMI